ncbi:hypothetical protein [[Limnothrix rosea] IAM M-220]|uniref:hypothetical protein n=1 Tax=[Limnothrix rosea] IAM M-220 TaxID=454133 RepID=UPI0009626111|nr:hypothetical protein [[Limnothrix rosea] IAM M-220]OKH18899.1 hypothetical protein NIES208_04085 [[Limnothrix rosea] IAM M-220]
MNNVWIRRSFITGFSLFALVVTACSPAIEEEVTTETPTPESTAVDSETTTSAPAEPTAQAPESTEHVTTPHSLEEVINKSENFYLGQYYNDTWAIAVAEGSQGYTYYGCSLGTEDGCLILTKGNKTCERGLCLFTWQTGNLMYQADISDLYNQVSVTQGKEVIVDTGELMVFEASGDDVPADREEVTGISEAQLKTLADQIYQAIYAEDWQAIAALSTDPVRVNYPDQEKSIEVAKNELPALLSKADLDQWQARIMTSRLDDLLLNQYGVMFGGGAIWASQIIGEPEPQIYSINIW